jgi:hypothetical protein
MYTQFNQVRIDFSIGLLFAYEVFANPVDFIYQPAALIGKVINDII